MRSRHPLGNPVLWIVAAFVVPELVKRCKPLTKVVGDTLVSAGEAFRRASENNSCAATAGPPVAEPVAEVAPEAPADVPHTEEKKSKKSKATDEAEPTD